MYRVHVHVYIMTLNSLGTNNNEENHRCVKKNTNRLQIEMSNTPTTTKNKRDHFTNENSALT